MGLGLLALRRRPWALQAERVTALLVAILSLGLLSPSLRSSSGWCIALFADEGCAGLAANSPGIQLTVIVFVALGLGQLLIGRSESSPSDWPGLGHLLCGLVAAAATVDHMLARYLLVEIAALPTLAFLLVSGNRGLALWRNILLIKVGGSLFLVLIQGLYALSNTWSIDGMMALAVQSQPSLIWPTLLCGLAAAWIKLGLPPADGWVRDALRGRPQTYLLSVGVGLPMLGGLLLYRLQPLAHAVNAQALLWILSAAALAWAILRRSGTLGGRLLDITGALLVLLTGTTLAPWYLWVLFLARVAILAGPWLPLGLRYPLADQEAPSPARGTAPLLRRASSGIWWLAEALQRQHTGLLNRNLLWTCLGIVAMVLVGLALSP